MELTQTYLLQTWSGYSPKILRSSRNIWTLCTYPGFHQIFSMIQSLIESINIYPSAALLHIEPKAFWSPRWSYRIIRWRLIQAVLDLCEFHTCKFSSLYRNIWLLNAIFGQFYFITAIFWLFGSKNCINERNKPKIAVAKYLPNAIFGSCKFSQNQKSHKARILCKIQSRIIAQIST